MNFLKTAFFLVIFCSAIYSQKNTNLYAGTLFCNIDGDTLTWNLTTTQTPDYFDAMTSFGPADKGVLRIIWDKVSSPTEIKTETTQLKGYSNDGTFKTGVLWADITNMPYVIKEGTLIVTENSGGVIKGTLKMTVELGGSSVIGEILKGRKESVLRDGYFEIKY